MYFVIYVSTAAKLFSNEELQAILIQSRAWNLAENITGMLLYKEGCFMQFLEGSREDVLFLLNKIKADPRHHNLIVLLQEEHPEREFRNWAMAFQKIETDVPLEIPGYGDYLELPISTDKFLTNPTKTLELLLAFKRLLPPLKEAA